MAALTPPRWVINRPPGRRELATLEIGLKEAPDRGWLSPIVLLLLATTLAAGTLFAQRTVRAQDPVVDLRTLADRRFAIVCTLRFLLGIVRFGSVYLVPVFLELVSGNGSLRIGETMRETGIAQIVTAPDAV